MVCTQKITINNTEIWLDEEGFLILTLSEETEADLAHVKECFQAYKTLGCGPNNKVAQLIHTRGELLVSPEAKKYAADNGMNYFTASAVIGSTLPVRLLVNFFISFYKPTVPFKIFGNENDARKWLRGFRVS